MKAFKIVFDAPWPVIGSARCCEAIVQATTITRALEIATGLGEVRSIGVSTDVPVITDPRVGATAVEAGRGE